MAGSSAWPFENDVRPPRAGVRVPGGAAWASQQADDGSAFSLKPMLVATACLAPLIFVLSTLLLQTEFRESRRLRAELNHSYERRFALESLLTLHLDLETAQRGFILTGEPAFLEPYEAEGGRIDRTFASLEEGVDPSSPLGTTLESMRVESLAKRRFSTEVIELAKGGRREEAADLVAAGRGKELMDRIRVLVARMEAQENAELTRSIQDSEQSRHRLRTIFLVANAVLSLLLLLAAILGMRANRARQSALEQLREAMATQEASFNSAPDGLILLDQDGRIDYLNPCAAKMFAYEADDLRQRHVTQLLLGAPSADRVTELLGSLESDGEEATLSRELEGRRADGSHFPAEVTVAPVAGLAERRYLAVVRNITQRKQVERMKSEFVSVVSHELRTPLTSIAGSLGLLAGGAAGALPERAAKLVGIAHANSTRLVRLVNDILDIEKLEAGMLRLTFTPIPLAPLIDQTIQENLGFADEFGVRLQADPAPPGAAVMGDEDRVVQVLTNLLSNAIKFSPAGEVVRVRVVPRGGMHRISVEDRGPGIPEEFRDKIFQKFTQVDSSDTRKKGGTGLGLTIVSHLVERLGGRLSFESEPGRGATFHVDLPRADETLQPEEPGAEEEGRAG